MSEDYSKAFKSDLSPLAGYAQEYRNDPSKLISFLQEAQRIYGYLPEDVLDYISKQVNVSLAETLGVATFYSQFRLQPIGKYLIMSCQGTACHVNGSQLISRTIATHLGIESGQTTEDGLFTLEEVACLGCCSLAPVITINGQAYGNLTPERAIAILEDIRAQEKNAAEGQPAEKAANPALEGESKSEESARRQARDAAGWSIAVGEGSCGIAAGAGKVHAALEAQLAAEDNIALGSVGCVGACYLEPIVDIYREGELAARLVQVGPEHAQDIVSALRANDLSGIEALMIQPEDQGFLDKQTRIALRHCGLIDPTLLSDYLDKGGYQALRKALGEMTPEQVIEEIKISGLAGRGGAGFPTWFKWNAARNNTLRMREKLQQAGGPVGPHDADAFLICNADEGDPGAFMDRALLESDPHSVLEGMLIGAYAAGANHLVVYVRAEYPLAIKHLERAREQALEAGFLGENIMGSGFSCDLTIKAGAGAFVCGEETALIASLEGERGMPRVKPPFPGEKGYFGKPSNVNNVETYGNVTWIIKNGGEAYAKLGTPRSRGTKVFALTGKIRRGGLVEVPMGMTLREVIYGIGGGAAEGVEVKAVQLGGPSGGCIPESLFDTIIDYDELNATGAIMGSGGMVVMDTSTCMVGMAKFFLDFTASESCGKCVPCRLGTKRMQEVLTRLCEGEGREGDIELLEELCEMVRGASLCGLGNTAPNPVLTTLRYFRSEYEAHIKEKKCPAHECPALRSYRILPEKCTGCTLCSRKCPANAITGERKQAHVIDPELCIRCDQCLSNCRFDAIVVE